MKNAAPHNSTAHTFNARRTKKQRRNSKAQKSRFLHNNIGIEMQSQLRNTFLFLFLITKKKIHILDICVAE
jgi:hypothetical protein